jgi:hypothetical protein
MLPERAQAKSRDLHKEKLRYLRVHFSPSTAKAAKPTRVRWAGYVTWIEENNYARFEILTAIVMKRPPSGI